MCICIYFRIFGKFKKKIPSAFNHELLQYKDRDKLVFVQRLRIKIA